MQFYLLIVIVKVQSVDHNLHSQSWSDEVKKQKKTTKPRQAIQDGERLPRTMQSLNESVLEVSLIWTWLALLMMLCCRNNSNRDVAFVSSNASIQLWGQQSMLDFSSCQRHCRCCHSDDQIFFFAWGILTDIWPNMEKPNVIRKEVCVGRQK